MSTPSTPQRPANPRASLAAFFSFLLPGLGQAYNGQSGLAWILIAPVLLLVVFVAAVLLFAGSGLLARMLDSRFLIGLIVLDLALLGWRLLAIIQAHGWREAASLRRWTTYATTAVVLVTLLMHAVPAYYAAKAIDTLGAVSREGGVTGEGHIPGFSELPEPSVQPDVSKGERVNILLVGVDALPGRTTQLTDTMLVVSLDPNGGHSAMISVPRDTYGAPLPDGEPFNQKLNALMVVANNNKGRFPDGGVATLKETIGNMLGVKIHYFGAINLLGFKQAVDSIGGVDITVERPINDPTYVNEYNVHTGLYLKPGKQHMDGHTALAYVRSRKGIGDSDFTRADRQQRLLEAMRAKLTAGNLVTALPGLLDAVKNTIVTDVPGDKLPQLAQAVQDADMSQLERIVLQPPQYYDVNAHSAAGYILIPKLDAIRAIGERLLANEPEPTPSSTPSASP
ncbi:MAG TPA: LCP family protein [Candidatus Limnocylindria bacterium]|nr:LCP family protein [Candidatus Limnocylindria bacterium]